MRISDWSSDVCSSDLTGVAWQIKEKLRWVRIAPTLQAARWRLSNFIRHAREKVTSGPLLAPVLTAIETVEKQKDRILQRWDSTYSNARMEALNGIFKAARARARGYRNTHTFIRSEEHTSELQSLMRISYAGFCL